MTVEAAPPLIYRRETLQTIFGHLRSGDSCVVVGGASMGKTRFIDCMVLPEVQEPFLVDLASSTLLLRVDCNRILELSEWGLYELLLTALVEGCGEHPSCEGLRMGLNQLRKEAIVTHNAHLAWRHLELAVKIAICEHGLRLHFLLDEFDEAYSRLPELALDKLRALRDAHKYKLSYVLFFRQTPERLRKLTEAESFYELFSRSLVGLRPYNREDTLGIITGLEIRKRARLATGLNERIAALSGGHPGLTLALFDLASAGSIDLNQDYSPASLHQQPLIEEECRKLWEGLREDEKLGLLNLVQGLGVPEKVQQVLSLKGLIQQVDGHHKVFNEIFAGYVTRASIGDHKQLIVNKETQVVVVEGAVVKNFTSLEFNLIILLSSDFGHVFSKEEIIKALYGPDAIYESDDQRADAVIKRVRRKIEPDHTNPRYLKTRRTLGYCLLDMPEVDD